ncbi:hypothetical protein HPO_16725 [Hyphomonas polymorpha PS728]|uniref:YD repeat-containing protein n=2 Tax=Hyphomonas polymorpha TaxID=74319 RepID=A0A062VCL3_9PROT|nr:hypothetical protein HPO_16725 [Hyphomonas polymorpha PS728]
MKISKSLLLICAALLMLSPVAQASSTITYTYDARGRLKTVSLSGGMHSGAVTTYTYDKANNRVRKQVTGA